MPDLEIATLMGPRLQLELLTQAHSQGMFELWSEPQVCEFSGPATDSAGRHIELPARSRSESDRLLNFWIDRFRASTGFRWAAVLRDSGEFVGAVGFNSLGHCSEYAYHFAPRFWGRGLAAEASRLALDWAFSQGATSVESFIEPGNVASIRMVERLGFVGSETTTSETLRYVFTHKEPDVQRPSARDPKGTS